MSTLPKTVEVKAGDSLATIAFDILGDSSLWREIAFFNDLDIFDSLEVGTTLKIPLKEEVQKVINAVEAAIDEFTPEVDRIINEIINSREVQAVSKILGIEPSEILKGLDLSSISEKLRATVSTFTDWQLIQWIL
jgi:hypothetical protein